MPTIDLTEIYKPQPKQAALHACEGNEILYGGAAGPGKSHALRHEGLNWALRIPGLQVYLFRRTFPEIEKNHVLPSLLEFPQEHGSYKTQSRRWEFNNGSMLHFAYCQYEQDVFSFQGAEIHLLLMDELTTFTEFMYDYLRSRVRCALDVPERYRIKIPGIVCASNPGGVGHEFAKRRWVDYAKPMEITAAPSAEGGMNRCYIPGKLEDNPILTQRDPGYISRLDALPEPYRSAYKDGNWDIFLGQAFNFNRDQFVIKTVEIPPYAQRYMTMDWGYGAPFSIGWWWVDSDGRIFRHNEWYGWNKTPNQGLRITDSQIADGIIAREKDMGTMGDRHIIRLAGPDCFQKKPDYRGGGQGPSTSEVFSQKGIYLSPGDPSRTLKIRQFRERLKVEPGKLPMMLIYDNCEQFIRTIPLIQTHKTNPEEIDESGEDHCFSGDTKVITDSGITEIEKLAGTTGLIVSVDGSLSPYRDCRLIKKNAETVKVHFTDGSIIQCTKDHEFLTTSGRWKKAIDLLDETCYISIKHNREDKSWKSELLARQSRNLMGNDFIFVDNIFNTRGVGSTAWFGNIITDLSRMVLRFIIRPLIEAKTIFKTLRLNLQKSIIDFMEKETTTPYGLNLCTVGPQSGTEARKGKNGIKNNMKSIAGWPLRQVRETEGVGNADGLLLGPYSQSIVQENVQTYGGLIPRLEQKTESARYASRYSRLYGQAISDFVHSHVLSNKDGQGLKVVKVKPSEKTDVFCLTVDYLHSFTLFNGVVVSNCFDESCHVCMARPIGMQPPRRDKLLSDAHIDAVIKGSRDPYETHAIHEQRLTQNYLQRELETRKKGTLYRDLD